MPFINGQEELLSEDSNVYVKSVDEIKELLKEHNLDDMVLDMAPGGSYDFNKVHKPFGNNLNHQEMKKSCVEFYKHYNWFAACDTYEKSHAKPNKKLKQKLLEIFLTNFKTFVTNKLEKVADFHPDVVNFNFSFEDSDISSTCEMSEDPTAFVTFKFRNEILEKILLGSANWENCYVGYQGSVLVEPDVNINALIRWMSMFGYVYQNRIVHDYR